MAKIKLCDFKKSIHEAHYFKISLLMAVGEELYYSQAMSDLICFSLNCIEEFEDKVTTAEESIEEHCLKVLKHFNFGEKDLEVTLVKSFTAEGVKEIPLEKKKPKKQFERFLQYVLNLKELPSTHYLPAKRKVEQEMATLSTLIKKYESKDELKPIVKNNGIPRMHSEKVLWDFYQRCIVEQREMLDFYLNGIKSRALHKATIQLFGIGFDFMGHYLDHPYKFGLSYNESYFDYEKIDQVGHRFVDYPEAIVNEMVELYNTKKEEYYKRLSAEYPEQKVFNEYDYYLSKIVSQTNRKEIFEELKTLYLNKNWFGFYALALTQVEGLFTEMQVMIENKVRGSLPDKVKIVRQGHPYDSSLDYYEYHIPTLRNRFLHIGHDSEIQWKAVDLLYDLSHILRLFSSLDNPFQNLVNLIKARKPEDFTTVEEILRYFSLLEEISKKRKDQFEQIKGEAEAFERDFLMPHCDIDFLSENLIISLPKKITDLVADCKDSFAKVGVTIDMGVLNYGEIEKLLDDKTNLEKIKDAFLHGEEFVDIVQAKSFLESYSKWLPSLPEKLKEELDKCYDSNKKMLAKLEMFYNKI